MDFPGGPQSPFGRGRSLFYSDPPTRLPVSRLTGQQPPWLSKEGLLREGHEAWCEEISHLSPEQLVLGKAARAMHQWLRDAGVKGGDAKGDRMVQAGREVLFKIKNAYFQEVLQGQPQHTMQAGKASRGFLPNRGAKVGQDKSVPVRALPASRCPGGSPRSC